jgi:hypothetical protein
VNANKNRRLLCLFSLQKPRSSLLILVPKTMVFFTSSCSKTVAFFPYSYSKTVVFFTSSCSKTVVFFTNRLLVPKTMVFCTYSCSKNQGLLYLFLFQIPKSSLLTFVQKLLSSLFILVPKTVVFSTYSFFENRGLLHLFLFRDAQEHIPGACTCCHG